MSNPREIPHGVTITNSELRDNINAMANRVNSWPDWMKRYYNIPMTNTSEIPEETLPEAQYMRTAVRAMAAREGENLEDAVEAYEAGVFNADDLEPVIWLANLLKLARESALEESDTPALASLQAERDALRKVVEVYGDEENWCDMDDQFSHKITFQHDLNKHGYELAQSVLTPEPPKTSDATRETAQDRDVHGNA